jgi:hypothetical protein
LETVPKNYISSLTISPDVDKGWLKLTVSTNEKTGAETEAIAYDKGQRIAEWHNGHIVLENPHLWSPADPFLYDLVVRLKQHGRVVDEVKSYFGMRKISIGKDEKGLDRIMLNNKPYYNLGTLDQGFWPEGLYTAPTDEALAFDIKAIKAMGFNTIRKHIKVEPARWYYWADKLGMLVWQDLVNPNQGLPKGAKAAFEKGSKEELTQLHNSPCITTWVLFNEKWGQYDQKRLTNWIKQTDPSRILNGHSGELLYVNEQLRSPSPDAYVDADMTDVHAYPDPMMSVKQPGKAQVCGEFGGIGVFIPDHKWLTGSAWGYIQEKPAALKAKYTIMQQHLQLFQKEGLSGSIYTQPFDVEGEQNGLMTYDRAVVKIPFAELRKIHAKLNPDMGTIPDVSAENADLTEPGLKYSAMLDDYIKGNRDGAFLKKLAMMASQVGDKPGAVLAGNAYIAGLKEPLSDEDIQNVSQFTKSTNDPGFAVMQNNETAFKKVIGDRQYTVNMMNMIFKGELEPMLNSSESPDWSVIEAKAKTYGAPGDEIFLRAKTVALYNKQDWDGFRSATEIYLDRYGKNISEEEQTMFKKAIDDHKGSGSVTISKRATATSTTVSADANDKLIKETIIDKMVNAAGGKLPDWKAITNTVAEKYDAVTADRTVTRAKLFFYYSKDWKAFATAIVNYTEKYEDKSNLETINTNAGFVLEHSDDKAELAIALTWAKVLVEKEPDNSDYQSTYKRLQEKLSK